MSSIYCTGTCGLYSSRKDMKHIDNSHIFKCPSCGSPATLANTLTRVHIDNKYTFKYKAHIDTPVYYGIEESVDKVNKTKIVKLQIFEAIDLRSNNFVYVVCNVPTMFKSIYNFFDFYLTSNLFFIGPVGMDVLNHNNILSSNNKTLSTVFNNTGVKDEKDLASLVTLLSERNNKYSKKIDELTNLTSWSSLSRLIDGDIEFAISEYKLSKNPLIPEAIKKKHYEKFKISHKIKYTQSYLDAIWDKNGSYYFGFIYERDTLKWIDKAKDTGVSYSGFIYAFYNSDIYLRLEQNGCKFRKLKTNNKIPILEFYSSNEIKVKKNTKKKTTKVKQSKSIFGF